LENKFERISREENCGKRKLENPVRLSIFSTEGRKFHVVVGEKQKKEKKLECVGDSSS
jgi:hypothetical protein